MTAITYVTDSIYLNGGGGGGGFTTDRVNPGIMTSPGIVTPFVGAPRDGLFIPGLQSGATKLTPVQLEQLIREHTFIEMAGSNFCLFCFALDHYRTRLEHLFVISEE